MKRRVEGFVRGGVYVITSPDGGAMKEVPLSEAKGDKKLQAAIARNGWEPLDGPR